MNLANLVHHSNMKHPILRFPITGLMLASGLALQSTLAGPLDPARIDHQAKWFVHLDHDGLRESPIGNLLLEEKLRPFAEGHQDPEMSNYVDGLWNGVHSITIYGDSFGANAEKTSVVVAQMTEQLAGEIQHRLAQSSRYQAAETKLGTAYERSGSRSFLLVFPEPGQLVVATDEALAGQAIAVLQSRAEARPDTDGLARFAGESGEGAIFLAGAMDFNQALPNQQATILLNLTRKISLAIWDVQGSLNMKGRLLWDAPETAGNMLQIMNGIAELVARKVNGAQGVSDMPDYFQSRQNESTVEVDVTVSPKELDRAVRNLRLNRP